MTGTTSGPRAQRFAFFRRETALRPDEDNRGANFSAFKRRGHWRREHWRRAPRSPAPKLGGLVPRLVTKNQKPLFPFLKQRRQRARLGDRRRAQAPTLLSRLSCDRFKAIDANAVCIRPRRDYRLERRRAEFYAFLYHGLDGRPLDQRKRKDRSVLRIWLAQLSPDPHRTALLAEILNYSVVLAVLRIEHADWIAGLAAQDRAQIVSLIGADPGRFTGSKRRIEI